MNSFSLVNSRFDFIGCSVDAIIYLLLLFLEEVTALSAAHVHYDEIEIHVY